MRVLTLKQLNPLAAVVDQAWLSILNFSIALSFIWGARKEEYAYYLLLVAPLMLVQGIQNAIVNSPLATFLPSADDSAKPSLWRTAVSLHVYLAITGAVLGGAGLYLYSVWTDFNLELLLAAGFSLAVVGTMAREAQRSFAYVDGRGINALTGDLAYGVVLLVGIGAAIVGEKLTAGVVLMLIGIAGILPVVPKLFAFDRLVLHSRSIRQFWSCSRWALPSVAVTWLNLSAYPFFAERTLGLSAVADIGASRLFLMPIGLAMTAWSNWYRPRISAWRASGDIDRIKRLTVGSLVVGWLALTLVAIFFIVGYPLIEPLFGTQYIGLQSLVLMWVMFFALSVGRNVLMATLMTDANGYRVLHHITWFSLALALPGLLLFSGYGAVWVVGVLCIVELAQLVLVWLKARSYWKGAATATNSSCSN